MSHGIRRKGRKLQKFLDNGGTILKIKIKGNPNNEFFEINQDVKPSVVNSSFPKWCYGHYWAPVLKFQYNKIVNGFTPLSKIRYMLVKYPDGLIKTIWI